MTEGRSREAVAADLVAVLGRLITRVEREYQELTDGQFGTVEEWHEVINARAAAALLRTPPQACTCGSDNPDSARSGHPHLAWCRTPPQEAQEELPPSLRGSLRAFRRERDRYEKASEVAMMALQQRIRELEDRLAVLASIRREDKGLTHEQNWQDELKRQAEDRARRERNAAADDAFRKASTP
jgi:hypothetical protein